MNPYDYIIRILIDAQSKVGPAFERTAAQIEQLDKKLKDLDRSTRPVNQRISQLEAHVEKARNTMRSWNPTLDAINRKSKDYSDTLTRVNRNMNRLERNADKAGGALARLNKVIDGLERKLNNLDAKMTEMGARTYSPKVELDGNEHTKRQIDALLIKLGQLERKRTKVRIDTEREILDREIRSIEKQLDELGAENRRIKYQVELDQEYQGKFRELERKAQEEHTRNLNRQRERRQKFLSDVLNDVTRELESETREHERAIAEREAADRAYDERRRRALQLSAEYQRQLQREREREEREERARTKKRLSELLEQMREATSSEITIRTILSTRRFNAEYDRLKAQLIELSGLDINPEVRLNTKQFQAERMMLEAWLREMGMRKVEVRAVLDYDRSATDRFSQVLDQIADHLDNRFQVSFIKAINAALNLAVIFSGPLLSSLTAVVGALTAVAAAAGEAIAGLGGLASAAVAQAIPAVGLLAAAFSRVGAVMKVVELGEKQRTQGAASSVRADTQRANALEAVRNAQQGVADAQRNLLEAQDRLNKTRIDGVRTLQDMVLAERNALLAFQNSQRALDDAIATGQGGSIRALQLQRDRDAINLARQRQDTSSAIAGGVENLESVRNARQAVEQAAAQLDRANRSLDRAKRNVEQAGQAVGGATDKYAEALDQLSRGERRLLQSIKRLKALWDDTDGALRGISDTIVTAFAYAVDQATDILQDPQILDALRTLAESIAASLRGLTDFFSSDRMRDALAFFSGEAAENVRVFGDILQSLVGIFVDVSRAASGIFADALRSVAEWLASIDRSLSSNSGQNKLANFFEQTKRPLNAVIDLFGALLGLFAALAGPGGAADAGTEGIERLTRAIRSATAWVVKNAEEVRKFFRDSIESTGEILKVIFEIGRALVETFDPNSVRVFAEFIRTAVIPALEGFVTIMNEVAKVILGIVDLIPSDVFKLLGGTAGMLFAITRLNGLLKGIAVLLRSDVFKNAFAPMLATLKQVIARIPILNRLLRNTAGATIIGPGAGGGRGSGGGPAGGAGGGTVVAGPGGGRTTAPKGGRFGRSGNILRAVGRGVGWSALLFGGLDFIQNRDIVSALHAADPFNILEIFGLKSPFAVDGPLGRYTGHDGWKNLWADITGQKTEIDKTKDAIKGFNKVVEDLGGISRLPSKMINELARYAEQLQDQAERNGLKDAAKSLSEFARNARTAAQEAKATEDAMRGLRREGVNLTTDVARTIGAGAVSDIEWGLRGLRQGIPSSMREFQRMLTEQVKLIQTTLVDESGKRMPGWYEAMAKTYELAIENIKRLRDEGKISAREANQTLAELERKYRSFSAKNPFDISRDFAKQIAEGRGERRKAIEDVISQIESMPARFRRTAAESVIGLTKGMESRGEVPKGTAKRLAYEIGQHFADMRDINIRRAQQMAEGIAKNINKIPGFVDRALNWIGNFLKTVIDKLDLNEFVDTASDAWDSVKRWTRKLPSIITRRAQGGPVIGPGTSTSDSIPALLSNGEHVWTAEEVKNAGGHGAVYALRRIFGGGGQSNKVGRYAAGGAVTPPGMAAIPGQGGNGTPAGVEYVNVAIARLVRDLIRRFNVLVTDGFDPTGRKHKSDGHMRTGTAVDFVPKDGNWDNVDKLARWAVSKGYTTLYDGRFGTTAASGHGRGHHLHIDFAKAISDGAGDSVRNTLEETVQNVVRRYRQLTDFKLRGPSSPLKNSLQAIFNEAVRAANNELKPKRRQRDLADYADDGGGSSSSLPSGSTAARIYSFFRSKGFTDAQAAAWVGNAIQESGLRPNVVNNIGAAGLFQWLNERRAGLHAFAQRRGTSWANVDTQLAYAWHELRTTERAAYAAIKATKSLEAAVRAITDHYERPGKHEAAYDTRIQYAREALRKYAKRYAAGGPVRGRGTGKSDDILALLSNGEHVWTDQEVRAAGGHKAVEAIRRLVLTPRISGDSDIAGATNAINVFLRGLAKFAKTAKKGPAAFASAIDVLFRDNDGAFSQIREAIGRFSESAARVVQDMQVRVTRSGIFRVGGAAADPAIQGQIDIANLRTERRMIAQARAETTKDIRFLRELLRYTTNEKDREAIRGRIQTLRKDRSQFTTDYRDNALKLFARQEQMQEEIDERQSSFFDRLERQNERSRRINTALGNDQGNIALFDVEEANTRSHLAQLQALYDEAVKTGNQQLAESLNDRIEEKNTRLIEIPVEKAQANVELIDAKFSQRAAATERRFRLGEILGVYGNATAKIDAQITDNLSYITELERALTVAQEAGAEGLVRDIKGKIEDLNATVAELAAQRLQVAIDEINRRAAFQLGLNDIVQRLANLGVTGGMAATGMYNIAALGRTDFASLDLALRERGNILQQQLAALQPLLAQAYAQGNQNAIESLTTQIASLQADIVENTKAIRDNTDAAFAYRVTQMAQMSDFKLAINEIATQINGALGSLSGTLDIATQVRLLRERGAELEARIREEKAFLEELVGPDRTGDLMLLRGNDLAAFLTQQSPSWLDQNVFDDAQLEAIRNLVQAILEHERALIENTKALKDVENSMTQTFSTSMWRNFRAFIFNGMGGLVGDYTSSTNFTSAALTGFSLAASQAGGLTNGGTTNNYGGDHIENYTINITQPTEVLDPTYVGQQIAFAKAGAGRI